MTVTGGGSNIYSANAVFTFSAGESVLSYSCSVDSGPYVACSSPYVVALAAANNPPSVNSSLYDTLLATPATIDNFTTNKFGVRSARLNSSAPMDGIFKT
ncbi:hypothetical protein EBR21_08570 [bacterium]|nr:hypothetical protein [bacterium]